MSDPSSLDDAGPTSHSFMSQRLRLNYLDWGNPGAPTLVLQHGGQDHARSWDWVARALRRDWHVVCPDLRGHGDSAWSPDGAYMLPYMVYDLAQFIQQSGQEQVAIIAHSLGGAVALRYAGLFPEKVTALVAIEGLGPSPKMYAQRRQTPVGKRWRDWIEQRRGLSGRSPRRYASIDEALLRMREANGHLSEGQARHLTIHGVSRNEDGTYSWKFDNYLRGQPPGDLSEEELHAVWAEITCPTLLCVGEDSWASNPAKDGRATHFRDAKVVSFENAGHWLHHDQLDRFLAEVTAFLPDPNGLKA
ncbi:alpha/beta hydrolase [Caulobacter sp. NIBR1757]|uniref:alpha/beta fold hydrolase n=1 Tax=Caulobacter sp. NIBR1757 TaxID=3016000 RepID=UPI0022F004D0|nr:alpha/beta hydrolase [Caulobacter sp. NIBR1757]WGM39341.1 2-succinyl-6-hydroxy-2, 4-cyclohexadiene-1-carboxylate synthase [Caulobacter sp. NIBR1757]